MKFFLYCYYSIPVLLYSCIYHLHLSVLPGWDFQWATVCKRERQKESEWEPGTCLHLFMINQTNRSPWACCLQWTYFPQFDHVFTAFLSLVKRKYDYYCTWFHQWTHISNFGLLLAFQPCFFLSKPVSFSLVSAHALKHVISSCPNWWPWQPAHLSRLTIIRFAHDPCRRKNSCLRMMGPVRSSVLSIRPYVLFFHSFIHIYY